MMYRQQALSLARTICVSSISLSLEARFISVVSFFTPRSVADGQAKKQNQTCQKQISQLEFPKPARIIPIEDKAEKAEQAKP